MSCELRVCGKFENENAKGETDNGTWKWGVVHEQHGEKGEKRSMWKFLPCPVTPPFALIALYIIKFQSSPVNIWNTVNNAFKKLSKLTLGTCSANTNIPPNSCMPNRANMSKNKNNRKSKLTMDFREFNKAWARFRNEVQYLVTLNSLSSRKHRKTVKPISGPAKHII